MNFKPIKDLTNKRILISNDDGIGQKGIVLLEKILHQFTDDVWVVAPSGERSCAGHSKKNNSNYEQELKKISDKHYSVDGTPSDCIRAALKYVLTDKRPDMIVTGINNGRNIAEDITYSGTIGAAIEGTLRGIPSVAVSQCTDGAEPVNWSYHEQYLPKILQNLVKGSFSVDTLISINFPNVETDKFKGIAVCRHGGRRFLSGTLENSRLNTASMETGFHEQTYKYPEDHLKIDDHITISALKVDMNDEIGLEMLSSIIK